MVHMWLVDRQKREFKIVGPVSNDEYWTDRINELQHSGRDVICFSTDKSVNLESEKKDYTATHGFTYNDALKF